MVISEVVTLFLYAISIAFLPEYFGMCGSLLFFPRIAPLLHEPTWIQALKLCIARMLTRLCVLGAC
jgi:hypothetical protein